MRESLCCSYPCAYTRKGGRCMACRAGITTPRRGHHPWIKGALWLSAYIGSIALANFMIAHVGTVCRGPEGPCLVPVWPGLLATSGTLAIGLSFTARDLTQDALGRWWTLGGILVGALLSVITSTPQVALASGLTLLVSETADFAVYTPLRDRHWLGAVFASNVVGLVVDTMLFLTLAFGIGSLGLMWGQLVGKVEMTLLAVAILWVWRRRALSQRSATA